ncbi:MAG: ferrous iron transport protein A [Pseudomonadales bacterium]|mgnify:CR=1 FL=1|jgi:ferrous iron transport protein A|nr:ferrous iron transport protein A [Pseudomonadales bacterium]MDP4640539.1 ferrous iron transport protein A [Pseudomonadales bacterium]MDP4764799.1 ferrous iron transport protein A [Pseudomonadales bacterium]MDP4874721.1 ferrous iron transport protein A [Pseudomonadales bacterium]MDP4911068.1 ferrous iron transport protein A [Pseudomonadales bacterium]
MTLAEMQQASHCRVLGAAAGIGEIQSRLYALGLYPGVTVEVLRFAPAGDPMQVRVGSTLLSIRKQEATLISVELL